MAMPAMMPGDREGEGTGVGVVLDVGVMAGVLIAEGMALVLDVDDDRTGAVSTGTASPGCSWYCAFTACCSWYARAVLALTGYNKTKSAFLLEHNKTALPLYLPG